MTPEQIDLVIKKAAQLVEDAHGVLVFLVMYDRNSNRECQSKAQEVLDKCETLHSWLDTRVKKQERQPLHCPECDALVEVPF